jgi:hypothetical protein
VKSASRPTDCHWNHRRRKVGFTIQVLLGALKEPLAAVLSAARNAACLFLPLWTFAVVTDHAVILPRDVIDEVGAEKVMGDSEVGIVVQQLLALTPLERSQPPNTV